MSMTTTQTPTKFQLWIVQQTGVSVAQQEAMTTTEWFDRFGNLSQSYHGPNEDENGEPTDEKYLCGACQEVVEGVDENGYCYHCSGDAAWDLAMNLSIDLKRGK